MTSDRWQLKQIADFFYLLVDNDDESGKDILQKRFKKDKAAHESLLNLIEKIDEMGYTNGVEFAFASKRFDTIKGTSLSLIEIRRFDKTWRVITYLSKKRQKLVMLDAFEAHKHISMEKKIEQIKPLAEHAMRLLEEGE